MIKFARSAVAALLVLGGAGVLAATPAAAAASAPGGTYVALSTPRRIVSAKLLKAGHVLTVKVAGAGHVPRRGAGAVLVTLTASAATTSGGVVAYGGHRPSTTNLQFTRGSASSDAARVPLSRGRVHLRNTARHGSVRVSVDVAGYYRAGSASRSNPGILHVLPTARRIASLRIAAHRSVRVRLGGHAGLPAEPGAAAVTLTVTGARRSGTVLSHRPDEPQLNLPVVRFAAGRPVSSSTVLRLSGGRATLVNTASRAVRVAVDVAGWYVIGFAQTAGAFQTLVPTRVYSARVPGGHGRTLTVGGRGGVPRRGVSAVLATVSAVSPAKSGALQAWRSGSTRPRRAVALAFGPRRSASNEVLIPVSSSGRIALRNASHGRVGVVVDVHGYVPSTALTPPAAGSTARYVRNITDSPTANANVMTAEGRADAAAGDSFVLLDIGAQLNDRTGVSLSGVDRSITYTNLVTALSAYLDGFATDGHRGTVAVGTNNGANDWTNYSATARGADWAVKVVLPLAAHGTSSGITVIGANDLEAGFFSTEPQAAAWKSAFLAHVPGTATALVYNGSADFCPKTWSRNAACNFGWTYAKLYALAGGSRTVVLPQIYLGYMATEWAMINATGGGKLRFLGALTEHALNSSTLTAGQGWVALQRAMSSVTSTGIGRRVADIHV